MRCVALGRKNWLFAGSKAGGDRAAAIYSVIESAKLNCLEPQAYIADVMAKIAGNWPAARWDELMPWNWQRSEEHTSELQSLMRNSYAVFCLKKKTTQQHKNKFATTIHTLTYRT